MAPVRVTQTGVHIRNKPKTGADQLLQDRPDLKSRFSAVPWTVLIDRSLKPVDFGVYACLSSRAFKGDTVSAGLRWVGDSLAISRMTVKRSIERLTRACHVEVKAPGRGSRAPVYRLTSPVFSKRQKVIVSDKSGNRMTTREALDRKREMALKLRTA